MMITGSDNINLYRLITLKHALNLEILGMKRKGQSVYKIVNQIERLIKHNESILEETDPYLYQSEEYSYARSIGWVDALSWVLNTIENGSPVSDAPLSDNISICSNCDTKTDDDTETKWSEDADPYCQECYSDDFDDKHRTTVEVEAKIKGDE